MKVDARVHLPEIMLFQVVLQYALIRRGEAPLDQGSARTPTRRFLRRWL